MKIIAIRHGETDWNLSGKLQGKTDNPLNAKGRKQAYETACLLAGYKFDVIISSPLKRATETAEIVTTQLDISSDVVTDSRLSERNFGDYEGLLISSLNIKSMRRWTDNLFIPNGETIRDVAARVFECLDDVLEKYNGGNILLVCHGHVIRTILWYFNGIPNSNESDVSIENCEIFEFKKYKIPKIKNISMMIEG